MEPHENIPILRPGLYPNTEKSKRKLKIAFGLHIRIKKKLPKHWK